jgi:hypothetical protein
MTDDQWFNLAEVLFYACIAIIPIVAVLSFLAYHRVTRGARFLELVLIWIVAVGGSIVGSLITGLLYYYLGRVDYPDDSFALLLGVAFGMVLGIPVGWVAGGLVGTMIAAFLVYLDTWRPMLFASAGALVLGALVSGVALVPLGWFVWAIAHI